ncbi:MAG: hypothetical protein ACLQU1_39870 [Bryobacteraceae bacterium]
MRLSILIASLAAGLWAQDPHEVVRKAIELDRRNSELERTYAYLQREETRELDAADKAKKVTIRTMDVRMMEGSPYRRLVARNDQPISVQEQKQEEDKLRFNIEERRKETPEQRQRRIEEWTRREEKRREPLNEVPDAYNFKLAGEETINGAACYVIEATPKPGYKPKSSASAVLTVLTGRMWISTKDYGWVKAEMEARDTFTLGFFFLRLSKGSRISIEQTPVSEGWLPKFVEIKFSARLLLVKSLREDLLFQFSDYQKLQTDAAVAARRQGTANRSEARAHANRRSGNPAIGPWGVPAGRFRGVPFGPAGFLGVLFSKEALGCQGGHRLGSGVSRRQSPRLRSGSGRHRGPRPAAGARGLLPAPAAVLFCQRLHSALSPMDTGRAAGLSQR